MALSQKAWDQMVRTARAHANGWPTAKACAIAITDQSTRFLDSATFLELGAALIAAVDGPYAPTPAWTPMPKRPQPIDPPHFRLAPVPVPILPELTRDEIWTRQEIRDRMSIRRARTANYVHQPRPAPAPVVFDAAPPPIPAKIVSRQAGSERLVRLAEAVNARRL